MVLLHQAHSRLCPVLRRNHREPATLSEPRDSRLRNWQQPVTNEIRPENFIAWRAWAAGASRGTARSILTGQVRMLTIKCDRPYHGRRDWRWQFFGPRGGVNAIVVVSILSRTSREAARTCAFTERTTRFRVRTTKRGTTWRPPTSQLLCGTATETCRRSERMSSDAAENVAVAVVGSCGDVSFRRKGNSSRGRAFREQ